MGGLAKGLDVIRAFSRESPALTLTEVAKKAKLAAATARRCLLTLEEAGYVTRSGRVFLLRPKVLELGAAYLESMNIETLTKTHLEDIASKTGDSAALCVLDGTEIVYLARASVRTLVRLEAHVGSRFPAYPTSMGRVLLAGLAPEGLRRYFERATLTALTKHTITDRAKLTRLIDDCRPHPRLHAPGRQPPDLRRAAPGAGSIAERPAVRRPGRPSTGVLVPRHGHDDRLVRRGFLTWSLRSTAPWT
jgi:IclR family transcriptional regulator, pca regulon regulatory protein